jgi:hypothetical protein
MVHHQFCGSGFASRSGVTSPALAAVTSIALASNDARMDWSALDCIVTLPELF